MSTPLKGRRAVVTGGGHGLGAAIATRLQQAGAAVEVWELDPTRLDARLTEWREQGFSPVGRVVDVSEPHAIVAAAEAHLNNGPADILVNNAGIGVGAPILNTRPDDWDRLFGINVFGVVRCTAALAPSMVAEGRGHVVHIASAAGLAGVPVLGGYAMTKHAVVAHAEALRAELAPFGVGVTAVCPGFVKTGILGGSRMDTADGDRSRRLVEQFMALPTRRPEVVGDAVLSAIVKNKPRVDLFAEAHLIRRLRAWPRVLDGLRRALVWGTQRGAE